MWMIAMNHPALDQADYFTYEYENDAFDAFSTITRAATVSGTRLDLIKLNGKTGENYVAKRFTK